MKFTDTFLGRTRSARHQKYMFDKWIEPYSGQSLEEMIRIWSLTLSPRSVVWLISLAARYIEWDKGEKPKNTQALRAKMSRLIPASPVLALAFPEAQRLLRAWEALYPEHVGPFLCMYHAGMRIGEVWSLNWRHIDFLRSHIQVTHTKNGRPRMIPMTKALEHKLYEITDNYTGKNLDLPVFKKIMINSRLKKACAEAGIRTITAHHLRHTFATLALDSGVSIRTVSEILGHANVSTTLNCYWHCMSKRIDLSFLED